MEHTLLQSGSLAALMHANPYRYWTNRRGVEFINTNKVLKQTQVYKPQNITGADFLSFKGFFPILLSRLCLYTWVSVPYVYSKLYYYPYRCLCLEVSYVTARHISESSHVTVCYSSEVSLVAVCHFSEVYHVTVRHFSELHHVTVWYSSEVFHVTVPFLKCTMWLFVIFLKCTIWLLVTFLRCSMWLFVTFLKCITWLV